MAWQQTVIFVKHSDTDVEGDPVADADCMPILLPCGTPALFSTVRTVNVDFKSYLCSHITSFDHKTGI